MKTIFAVLCILGFGCCLLDCSRIKSYPAEPEIHNMSILFRDITTALGTETKAVLVFSFVDGDGDIGVTGYDSISKIHYTWYKKLSDGAYEPYQFPETDIITDSIVIPYSSVMNREEAQNKTLKGDIQVLLTVPSDTQEIDTMRVEYYMFDRARHKSNVAYTPDFSILNPPVEPQIQ